MKEDNENQKAKTIQVVDKRRFDASGQERSADEPISPSAPSEPKLSQPDSKLETPKETAGFTMRDASEETTSEPVAFTSFIMSLATQVLVQLGEMPPPQGMEIPLDLEAARQTIDIMTMLQRRTQGNLSTEEARFMEEVLHSLRLSFINAKKKVG